MVKTGKMFCLWLLIAILFLFTACSESVVSQSALAELKESVSLSSEPQTNMPLQEIRIATNEYSMRVTDEWKDNFKYYTLPNNEDEGYDLCVEMISENEYGSAYVFGIAMISMNKPEDVLLEIETGSSPLGILSTRSNEKFFIARRYSSQLECTEKEEELFFSLIETVDSITATFKAENGCTFIPWEERFMDDINKAVDDTPYAATESGWIGQSFTAYRNYVTEFLSITEDESFIQNRYGVAQDGVDYYFSGYTTVGVKGDEIVFLSIVPLNQTVSEALKSITGTNSIPLFGVIPKQTHTNKPGITFVEWKIDNGYIGVLSVGSTDVSRCYNNTALAVIHYSDKSYCSLCG